MKRNKWTSIVLFILFVITSTFGITDYGKRLINITIIVVGYEEPLVVEAKGEEAIRKRLNLAKLETVNYKISSSTNVVVKLVDLPMVNHFYDNAIFQDTKSTYSIVTSVSPIKSVSSNHTFDGAACRLGIEASSFDKNSMAARFEVKSLSCTDNEGYAHSIESNKSIGFVSELVKTGIAIVDAVNDGGYMTLNAETNYLVQFYKPIKSIDKKGISLVGRF